MLRHATFFALLLALSFAAGRAAFAAEPAPALIPVHGAASTSFAQNWTGAFITGNGTMGAMVMGASTGTGTGPRPQEDTLYFSHNRLFLPVGTRQVVPLLADALDDFRQTIRTRGYGPALTNILSNAQKQQFPGLMYPDPFLPACEFKLKMPAAGTPRDYLRTEDFQTGEVAIYWTDDAGSFVRKLFISRADNVAVLWIGPAPETATPEVGTQKSQPLISCDLWIPPIPNVPVRTFQQNNPAAAPADGAANALIQSASDVDTSGILLHNVYREGKGSGYDAAVRAVAEGGTASVAEGKVSIQNARSILVLLRIEPFAQITSNSEGKLRASLDELSPQYDKLLAPHVKLHQELFNRVALDLGGSPADRKLTTDALLARAGRPATRGATGGGAVPVALLERLYEAARYELICSAGDRPPNLQGLWAANWAPSVSLAGDYAFDASFHLSLASALSCHTPELLQGAFHLADESLRDWQLNAQNLFGARGIVVPLHQSSSGKNIQWSDRSPGSLCWTAGAALLAHWYYDYYLYTGDRQFLATRAVPFMKQAARFYEDFLTLDSSGKYRFSPSFSTDNAAGDNSTQDVLAATELLTNLITACRELAIESGSDGGIARWNKILSLMPPCLIAPNGELQEWALKGVMNKPLQRHIPHLYAIYQSHLFDPETTPELWKASHAAFETRLNQWFRLPNKSSDAFITNPQPLQDRLQMALCAARFGEGDTVLEILSRIAAKSTYPSLMTQRYEDGRTFVVDGAGAIPEIINSCLVFSQPGRLDLLPALPPNMPTGEVRGLAGRSLGGAQLTITRLHWSPGTIDLELVSTQDQSIAIHLPKTAPRLAAPIVLKSHQAATFHFPLNGN